MEQIADAIIAISYFSLGVMLLIMYLSRDYQYKFLTLSFAIFMIFSGVPHLIGTVSVHGLIGEYQLVAKISVAIISFLTVIGLMSVFRAMIKMEDPRQTQAKLKTEQEYRLREKREAELKFLEIEKQRIKLQSELDSALGRLKASGQHEPG